MLNIYKKFFILTAALLFTVSFAQSHAATLHAVLVGDTLGDNIQSSVKKDLDHMQKEMGLISRYTHLPLRSKVFTGEIISTEILNEIDKIQVAEDDVVFFYFSGHGYREESKESIWPNLYVTSQNKGIDFAEIQEILKKKNPKFLLAIVDCCNSFISDAYAPQLMHKKEIKAPVALLEANYQHLFSDFRGTIFVSSSSIGEYSWGSNFQGGIYTYNFLLDLHKAVKSTEIPNWEILLGSLRDKLASDKYTPQTPQFEADIRN